MDGRLEGSKLDANFSFEQTTKTREKRRDKFGDERKKNRHARERPFNAPMRSENVSLDPKLLKRGNGKRKGSKDVHVDVDVE